MLKTCKKCGVEKPCDETHFKRELRKRKTGTFETTSGVCLVCLRASSRKYRAERKAADPASVADARRRYRSESDAYKKLHREQEANRRLRKAVQLAGGEQAYRRILIARLVAVLEKMANRADWPAGEPAQKVCWVWNRPGITRSESYRLRYAIDEEFQISERIRRQINKRRKRDGVGELIRGAIRRNGESGMVQKLLGYSVADLKQHLERQFVNGMTWERFMAGEIHIDHITPQSAFELDDEAEWRKCWCLSNLRPMWAKENLAKSDKQFFLI